MRVLQLIIYTILTTFIKVISSERPKFLIAALRSRYPWEEDFPTLDYVDQWDVERVDEGHVMNVDIMNEVDQVGTNEKIDHTSVEMLRNREGNVDYTNFTKARWEVMSYDDPVDATGDVERRKRDLIRNIKLKRKGKMNRKSIKERFGSKNENVRQSKKITRHNKRVKRLVERDGDIDKELADDSKTEPSTSPTIPPPFTYPHAPPTSEIPSFLDILEMKDRFDFDLLSQKEEDILPWDEPLMIENCWLQKMLADKYSFSPSCTPDAHFQNKQCYLERCWCVDSMGLPRSNNPDERFFFRSDGVMLECLADIYESHSTKTPSHMEEGVDYGRMYEKESRRDVVARKYLEPDDGSIFASAL